MKSLAVSNLERINGCSKNPKSLSTTIKSILHSSTLAEQLQPADSKPLADSLASFFHEKIISFKLSISSKHSGPPFPFDFDKPHTGQMLNDFTPVTPTEVTQLLHSMSNKSSPLDYIATSLLKSFSYLTLRICSLIRPPSHRSLNMLSLHPFLKSVACLGLTPQISDPFQTSIPSAKFSNALHSSGFSLTFHFLLVFLLCNPLTENFIPLKPHY